MHISELFEAQSNQFYNPSAVWLHGSPLPMVGDALKRYGRDGGDAGALFFCKDVPVGRWYAATYARDTGKVWTVKLSAPVDSILDLTNPRHRSLLRKHLNPQEVDSILKARGSSGHMDWTSVDDELFEPMGFRGCVFQERPKGMETGLPPQMNMTVLPEPVLSVGMFFAEDCHITGFVPPAEVWNFFR
jgi:hypothetical protein